MTHVHYLFKVCNYSFKLLKNAYLQFKKHINYIRSHTCKKQKNILKFHFINNIFKKSNLKSV